MISQQQNSKVETGTQDWLERLSILFKGTQVAFQKSDQTKQSVLVEQKQYRKATFSLLKVMSKTLKSEKVHPFSKLLVVRFFRQSLSCINYGFLTLAGYQLAPILLQLALFDKQSQDQQRGRKLFSHIQQHSFVEDAKELQVIGFSLHKLSLQIIVMLDQWLPNCPYHKFPMPSVFANHHNILVRQNVKVPSSFSYFKTKDTERFTKQYNQKIQKSNLSQKEKDIDQFYNYIFKKLESSNPQQYNQYLQILKGVLNSGDMYCTEHIINFLKNLLNNRKSQEQIKKAYEVSYQLLRQVDYQFIESFEQQILPYFIEYSISSKQNMASPFGKKILQNLWMWGFLIKNDTDLDVNNHFKRLWICLARYSANAQKSKEQLKQFEQNKKKKKQMNSLKFKNMKWGVHNYQSLDENLRQLESIMNKTQIVSIQNESQTLDQANTSNYQKSVDSKKMFNYKLKVNTNTKNRQKGLSSDEKGNNRQHFHFSNSGPSFIQKLRQGLNFNFDYKRCSEDVKALKSIRRKTEARSSIKLQSCPILNNNDNRTFRYSQSQKGIFSEKSLICQNNQYEKRIKQLQLKVLRSEKKQKQYESLLQQKEIQIKKVSVTPKSHPKLYSLKKINHVQMTPRIKEKNFVDDSPYLIGEKQIQQYPSQSRITKSSKKAKSIELNPFKFSLKIKKEILKSKILLLKNSDIQIGLITLNADQQSQNQLKVNIYVTPLKQFHSIAINIKNPQWCYCKILNNREKQKVKPTIQYIINTQFLLFGQDTRNRFQSLPQLHISSSIGSRIQNTTMVLPIFISKFFIQRQIQQKDCQKIPLNEKSNFFASEPKKIEQKIFKSFDNFLKYFPNSILIGDKTVYAFKINFEENQAIIIMKILDGQFMQIELSPTSGNDWNESRVKLVKDAYCSLLTI